MASIDVANQLDTSDRKFNYYTFHRLTRCLKKFIEFSNVALYNLCSRYTVQGLFIRETARNNKLVIIIVDPRYVKIISF